LVEAPQFLAAERVSVGEFAALESGQYFCSLLLLLAALCKVRVHTGGCHKVS
jgi:hypothetical protein